MHSLSSSWQGQGQRIAFVPTMGNLHEGHLSLVDKAQQVGQKCVVSIFVNPLQFAEGEDFASYPRTLDDDLARLSQRGVVDAVFIPTDDELYPNGKEATTRVEVPGISAVLEGQSRSGHFSGVTTVVSKLFNIVQPDVAVFGEKDFQQLMIIRRMVADLNMAVEIVGMPTLREANGLAMSSRNRYLSESEREQASQLYQVLQSVRQQVLDGNADFPALEASACEQLKAAGFEPDYVAIRDASNLETANLATPDKVILAAARLGVPRLIDNLRV